MSTLRAQEIVRHVRDATLLVLLPLLLLSGAQSHFGHRVERDEPPVFADALHAGEAHHWEAASTTRVSHCPDCLAPTQPLEPASAAAIQQARRPSGTVPAGRSSGHLDSRTGRSHPPRAPPLFELS